MPPTLFDLGPPLTTRAVADAIRRGGVDALTGAVRRGDDVTYQEIVCRSAFNRVAGMPFNWTLNPYRGCTHGCHYCFARRYQSQLEMGPGDEFSSVVLVKTNFPDVLARELRHPRWRTGEETVALGTATDPYQPIEGRYRLTRRTLDMIAQRPIPLGLITKGPMVLRDCDLLAKLARRTSCTVVMSVPTVDEEAWAALEPGTAPPRQRLRAVRALADAGVPAGVLMAPIVPGISSHPAKIERTIQAIADHGAAYAGGFVMHLEGGTRVHFMEWLTREHPHLVARYERLFAGKYATKEYAARVRHLLRTLTARYGVTPLPRRPGRRTARRRPNPTQAGLFAGR